MRDSFALAGGHRFHPAKFSKVEMEVDQMLPEAPADPVDQGTARAGVHSNDDLATVRAGVHSDDDHATARAGVPQPAGFQQGIQEIDQMFAHLI